MSKVITRALLLAGSALGFIAVSYAALIFWPDPLFAFSLRAGKIVISSDQPIPKAGGERLLRDCEKLLERSPLKAEGREYLVYVTNADWRQRLYFLPHPYAWGSLTLIHWEIMHS